MTIDRHANNNPLDGILVDTGLVHSPVTDINELSVLGATQAIAAVRGGSLTVEVLIRSSLTQIAAAEPSVRARQSGRSIDPADGRTVRRARCADAALPAARAPSHLARAATHRGVLITHSVVEAIYLADRILVTSAHPGRIKAEWRVDTPRPRDPTADGFRDLERQIYTPLDEELAKTMASEGA